MLKNLFLMAAVGFSFNALQADSAAYPPLSQQENDSFQKQVDQALTNAQKQVEAAKNSATRRDIAPTTVSAIDLQNALIQLDVKKTLINNFKGTESLQSPLVRGKLLEVLNKSIIMPSDLANLQGLVLEEKARIRAAQAQTQSQTVPSTSTPTDGTGQ